VARSPNRDVRVRAAVIPMRNRHVAQHPVDNARKAGRQEPDQQVAGVGTDEEWKPKAGINGWGNQSAADRRTEKTLRIRSCPTGMKRAHDLPDIVDPFDDSVRRHRNVAAHKCAGRPYEPMTVTIARRESANNLALVADATRNGRRRAWVIEG